MSTPPIGVNGWAKLRSITTSTSFESSPSRFVFCDQRVRRKVGAHALLSSFSRLLIIALLLIAGIHPNPGPRPPRPPRQPSSILQFNCNGVRTSLVELRKFLKSNNIVIACLQESKLSPLSKDPDFGDFTVVRKDRPRGRGGGVVILVHHSIGFSHLDVSDITANDAHLEIHGIKAIINNSTIDVYNCYVPPASSCAPGYCFDASPILDLASNSDALVLGDFNAHHDACFSSLLDARGIALSDAIDHSSLVSINLDSPTRLPSNAPSSSPDISVASPSLLSSLSWSTSISLNSDHLPILISLVDSLPPPRLARSYTNFRQANWEGFKTESEALFSQVAAPTSCDSGEKVFRHILQTASKHNIPAGFRRRFSPETPRDALDLARERDAIRRRDPSSPDIARLNEEIRSISDESAKQSWVDHVEESASAPNSPALWQLLRRLSGKRVDLPPNNPITFPYPSGPKTLTVWDDQ